MIIITVMYRGGHTREIRVNTDIELDQTLKTMDILPNVTAITVEDYRV